MGYAAYGDGATRQTFADAGRKLVDRVPGRPDRKRFPRMTLSSTWPRAVAPVRRDRSPTPSCRRESGRMARGGYTACRPSSSTGPNVGHVPCGPSASQPRAGRGGGWIHPQEGLQEARCSRAPPDASARWNTGWPDWCSWASASPAISAGSRRFPVSGGYSGQPDPGGGQNRAVGQTVLSPMLRPFSARSGSDTTAEISLPNQGFSSS